MNHDQFIFSNLQQLVELSRQGDQRHLDAESRRLPRTIKQVPKKWRVKK